jgi:hypothetical protein
LAGGYFYRSWALLEVGDTNIQQVFGAPFHEVSFVSLGVKIKYHIGAKFIGRVVSDRDLLCMYLHYAHYLQYMSMFCW